MPQTQTKQAQSHALTQQRLYTEKANQLLSERYAHPPMAHVHSFGCQQNVSDGEKIKGMLAQIGYGFTQSPLDADLVIYNTCAVRENAEDRVFGNVGALKPVKLGREGMLIGLCGCMMQQQSVADKIKASYPYVDIVFGTNALHALPELLYRRLSGEKRQFLSAEDDGGIVEGLPIRRDGFIKAYVPVMNGCDNFCTYCIVPHVRGRERSRHAQDILDEASSLVRAGYRELTLLGQNVNSYGKGLAQTPDFAGLLRRVDAIPGDFWIRFMTSHPKDCTRALIDAMANSDKICHHLHLPVQSGCDRVLKRMNRRYTVAHYLEMIDYARKKMPEITFSSDIIVGFPGETREEFLQTLELIRQVRYSALFTFIYSPRSGTPAAKFDDPVPAAEKSLWMRELLETQQEIRSEMQGQMVGRTLKVLCEGEGKNEGGWLSGRTASNDIVEFRGSQEHIGQFVQVKIEHAMNWALFGNLIETP